MKDQYYRVRPTKHPTQNGSVIRFRAGKIVVLAGTDAGCCVKVGDVIARPGYFITKISRGTAYSLKQDAWAMTQLEYSTLISLAAVPGTPEWAAAHLYDSI